MTRGNRWLLPEGVEEVLPPDAACLDALARDMVDLFRSWGYELVMPPLVEHLESLLTGTGEDLDLQTFKVTDQLSGRMLGIRADATPQVARIDAHRLRSDLPSRLCYLGTVLHARPKTPGGTRAPLQLGAELYGHAGRESEAEIAALMLQVLDVAGVRNVHVDLGHVGIYRGLIAALQISGEQEAMLFDSLQRKSAGELREDVESWHVAPQSADVLYSLIELNGGPEVLGEARRRLKPAGPAVLKCLDELERTADLTARRARNAPLYFDLAELRGYRYYTGLTFAAYVPGRGQGIAFGGRYDDIGAAFGRPRPAVGFSTDLRLLYSLAPRPAPRRTAIFAPASEVPGLQETIDALRADGEIVVCELPGQHGAAADLGCDRELVLERGRWVVKKLKSS
ncbi:MAG TPA: ATP phosphoribosyltransferase regulatory subunit [Gammaproteobacteria bacterium]